MTATDIQPRTPADALEAPVASRRAAALSGALGAGVALAVGELAAGAFADVPSLTTSVGQLFIPFTPEPVKDVAIALFGTADKPVFVAGVVVLSLLIGAFAGRRARSDRAPALLVFLGFGLFGLFAASSIAGSSAGLVLLTVAASVTAGLWALFTLLRLATPPPPRRYSLAPREQAAEVEPAEVEPVEVEPVEAVEDRTGRVGRRPFLLASGAVAAVAGGATLIGTSLQRQRAAAVVSRTDLTMPTGGQSAAPVTAANRLAVDGITPIIVPNDDFYRIDTALGTPVVDAATWEMSVTGMVDRPITLDLDALMARDVVERYVTLQCVSNEIGDDLVGNALWTGVLLAPLLEEAGLQPGAGQVVGRSIDGWTAGFPIEAAFDRDAMIAFGMNGEPLPAEHGFPARLVVPGLYGYVSATKWLEEIEITTWEGFDGYWVPRGWAKEGPIKTASRIDVPRDGTRLEAAGETVVAGVAWAPGRGVSRVEVRRDEGEWVEAELSEPLSEDAWVQWRAVLDLPDGPSRLQVRATDGNGETQTDERVPPRPDGATGHHTIRVFT